MVEEWFVNKGKYEEGLALLAQIDRSRTIYLKLKNKPGTQRNLAALKYELNKYRYAKLSFIAEAKKPKPVVQPINVAKQRIKASNQKVTMAMLSNPTIRSRFVEKNKAFYERWELKKQLNELPATSEDQPIQLITQIMKLTTLIDTIWREVDYYISHNQLMPTANDYNNLNTDELRNIRQKLYQKRTKRQATLDKWNTQIQSITDSKRLTLQSKIDKQQETITTINLNIEKLSELIKD